MRILHITRLALLIAVLLTAPFVHGQQDAKKAVTLRGTVEQVNTASRRLSVANEPVEGGMGAMTMTYSVDKDEVFSRVKAGDRITAKMYEGDSTLYEVEIMQPPGRSATQSPGSGGLGLDDLEDRKSVV